MTGHPLACVPHSPFSLPSPAPVRPRRVLPRQTLPRRSRATSTTVINAHNRIVAPGFIDLLGNSQAAVLIDPKLEGKVAANIYPYTATSTDLTSIVPAWALEGGYAAFQARLMTTALPGEIIRQSSAK